MLILRSVALFVLAALAEIGGVWLVWQAVREHRGGLPTMTADGQHIVGPAPGAEGFFVAGGCNVAGLSISPAIGQALAAWIVDGAPPLDLSAAFAPQAILLPPPEADTKAPTSGADNCASFTTELDSVLQAIRQSLVSA